MKIGMAFIKRCKKTNKIISLIHFDKEIKPSKVKNNSLVIYKEIIWNKKD